MKTLAENLTRAKPLGSSRKTSRSRAHFLFARTFANCSESYEIQCRKEKLAKKLVLCIPPILATPICLDFIVVVVFSELLLCGESLPSWTRYRTSSTSSPPRALITGFLSSSERDCSLINRYNSAICLYLCC